MVRTKADCANVRAAGAKAPRKIQSQPSDQSGGKKKTAAGGGGGGGGGGGNPYCPRETPPWQKEITHFFSPVSGERSEASGSTTATVHEAPGEREDVEDKTNC